LKATQKGLYRRGEHGEDSLPHLFGEKLDTPDAVGADGVQHHVVSAAEHQPELGVSFPISASFDHSQLV